MLLESDDANFHKRGLEPDWRESYYCNFFDKDSDLCGLFWQGVRPNSKNGEAVMGLLRELHDGGATICMVTHDPRFARHAERTVHLFDGRVVEEEHGPQRDADAQTLGQSGFGVS